MERPSLITMLIVSVLVITGVFVIFDPDRGWPEPDKVVTLFTPEDAQNRKIWSEAIRRFELLHRAEGYRVRWLTATYDAYGRKIQFMEAARLQADVIYMDQKDFPLLCPLGVTEDLIPYLAQDASISLKAFAPVAINQMLFDGKLYALPILYSPTLLFYNQTEFRKLGIPIPHPDSANAWSYSEFLDAAKKIRNDHTSQGETMYGVAGVQPSWFGFVWREGGQVFSADQSRCLLESPEALRGLRLVSDLFNVYKVAPRAEGQDDSELFKQGRVGMLFGSRFSFEAYREIQDFEWGVAPIPRSDNTGLATTAIIVDSLALAHNGHNKKLGWELLKFLASEEMMQYYAQSGSALPALSAVAEKSIDPKIPGDELFLNVPEDSRYLYLPPKAAKEVHMSMVDKLPLIYSGVKSAEDVAHEMAELIDLGMRRCERREKHFQGDAEASR